MKVFSLVHGQLNLFESVGAKMLLTKEAPRWLGPTGQEIFETLISQIG